MKQKWYDNDWLVSLLTAIAIALTIIGNYYYNGGNIVW